MALHRNNENQMQIKGGEIYPPYKKLTHVVNLNEPNLYEVKSVLEPALRESFNEANVSVVPCPDLRESPFHLAAPGLSGETIIMKMGGTEFLWINPMHNMDKSWYLPDLLDQFCLGPSSFVIGASRSHGTINYEVATNFTYRKRHGVTNKSYFNFVNENGQFESKLVTNPNRVICNLYGNLFISNGCPGYVLKVYAKGRRTDMNFPTVIQTGLQRKYEPNDFIGLGGTFVIKNGIVRNRIRCPSLDLNSPSELIHHTSTPLVAVGTILSRDKHITYHDDLFEQNAEPTILESHITTEHFHTFAYEGVRAGGHFINDITPDDIEYEGYFNVARKFIRVSPPQRTYRLPY